MNENSIYVVACQSGGGEKSDRFTPIFWEFKKKVQNELNKSYSEEINLLSIVFRVDGKFSSWGEKGINRMRLKKKMNRITIDIGITEDILDLPADEIWNFIWQEFDKATNAMLEKLKKSKIEFDFKRFNEDFNSFKESHFGNIPS